jgi:hypothetical protein
MILMQEALENREKPIVGIGVQPAMSFDECICVLREETQALSPEERDRLKKIFDSQEGNRIFMELEPYERSGRLTSPRFKAALKDLFWSSR